MADVLPGIDRPRLRALVHAFYADVRADAELGPLFERVIGDQWDPHLDRMVEFWCTLTIGSRSFTGNVLLKHMQIDGLQPWMFDRWLALWARHTGELFGAGEASELQNIATGIARKLIRAGAERPAA